MIDFTEKDSYTYEDLLDIVRILRSEEGCPWDKVQTHESLRRGMIEETYEVVEAIDDQNLSLLKEELGDVLLQVVFHADIEKDAGNFSMDDVCDGIVRKMLYRHPHVFANDSTRDEEALLNQWDALKKKEKGQIDTTDSLKSVAKSLPGLWRAEKIQNKAAKTGFDWKDIAGAMDKLTEEVDELKEAVETGYGIEEELGDVLFATVKVARFAGVDPELAISATCEKFIKRFQAVEDGAKQQGKRIEELTLNEMMGLWNRAKRA